jgi:LEA14-like dessication related protein
MFKILTRYPYKRTQTGSSAFFCARRKPIQLRVAGAFLIALVLSSHSPAVEEKKPTLKLQGVSIKSIDWRNQTAETALSIAIKNPGPALRVKDLRYRLKLNEKQAAQGKYGKVIQLPAESTTTVELPCSVDLSALPGVAWAVVAGGFDVHYQLDTEFTVPLFGSLSPKVKTSFGGDLSLARTVTGWTAQIKERLASK